MIAPGVSTFLGNVWLLNCCDGRRNDPQLTDGLLTIKGEVLAAPHYTIILECCGPVAVDFRFIAIRLLLCIVMFL